jgi:hypothetical protein
MEIVVMPDTTYMLIEHIHDSRRICTDDRDWPATMDNDPQTTAIGSPGFRKRSIRATLASHGRRAQTLYLLRL